MNWWDVEFGEIRMLSAEETAAFLAEVKRDNRTQRRQQRFQDHRLRRASFIQPVDVDGNAITERFTSMDIYARDGGICQLCLEPVDLDAPQGPEALSIDHIDREGPTPGRTAASPTCSATTMRSGPAVSIPELARARLHHKVATNEKVDPADHFPRRSPFTGHVVSYEERRQQEFAAADMARRIDTPPPPRTATERLVAAIRSLFRRG